MLLFHITLRFVARPILLGLLADIRKTGVERGEVGQVQAKVVAAKSCQSRHGILLSRHHIRVARRRMGFVLMNS